MMRIWPPHRAQTMGSTSYTLRIISAQPLAELPQQPAVVLEEYPQHPGDGEDDLAVRDIEEKFLSHPLAPLLKPLRMARRTEATGAAGEHQEVFRLAVRTADAGKPAAGIAVCVQSQTPAQTKTGTAEQELLELVQDWMDAEVKADMAFLDRFIAEDCIITDPVGAVWTKAQFLTGLKSGEGAVISSVLDNMKARVYGDAAVVTGRMTARQTFKGKDISGQYQCTDMFIKKAGRWQCVAIHLSLIAQK